MGARRSTAAGSARTKQVACNPDRTRSSCYQQGRHWFFPMRTPTPPEPENTGGTLEEQIARAMKVKSGADSWIGVTCAITGLVCVVAAPFTFGTSLLAFLAVAPIAAIGCTATESKRQTELLKVIARKGS